MTWLTLLANLARAAAAFLEVRAVEARYSLQRRIAHDIENDTAEIERLRNDARPFSQWRADRLRDSIVAANGVAVALSASSAAAAGGRPSADAGRDVPSAKPGGLAQ